MLSQKEKEKKEIAIDSLLFNVDSMKRDDTIYFQGKNNIVKIQYRNSGFYINNKLVKRDVITKLYNLINN